MPLSLLDTLLQAWQLQLTLWAENGALGRATEQALVLNGRPPRLQELVKRWSSGTFEDLPPVVLLPATAMPTAVEAKLLLSDQSTCGVCAVSGFHQHSATT